MLKITEDLVFFLGEKCALCLKPFPDGKTWQIHHRKYKCSACNRNISSTDKKCPHCGGIPEKTSKDFKEKIPHIVTRGKNKGKKRKKTVYHTEEYYEYLKPIVMKEPERFAPMHINCHLKIGKIVIYNRDKAQRQRLCDLAMEQD